MGRQTSIARSIALAITKYTRQQRRSRGFLAVIRGLFSTLFSFYHLTLAKLRPADFARLRRDVWLADDDGYIDSFHGDEGERKEDSLHAIGDMGFSGSTFYATSNARYLVKSIPRHSEYTFFRDELLTPYVQYMTARTESLLVRITDFLWAPGFSFGKFLGLAPSHHIIMENIMYGKEEAKRRGEVDWEDWDLKPTSYFYPERDIAGGMLTSEATKNQLADEFHDKLILSKKDADALLSCLDEDTQFLAAHNAVDYSLFLVRMQVEGKKPQQVADPDSSTTTEENIIPTQPPSVPPAPPSWRTGVASADGKHLYRAALLDFFWAKHKPQAKVMTFLVNTWNVLVSREGPMSITTEAYEYRERFMKMCRSIIEVKEDTDTEE